MNELKLAIVAFLSIEFKIPVSYRVCSLIFWIDFLECKSAVVCII